MTTTVDALITTLRERHRLTIDAGLRPAGGARFQPTGFPNLGAATFRRPGNGTEDAVDCLVVESTQSLVNHFEALGWDAPAERPTDLLSALPWVRVVDPDGRHLTSSRQEPHRLSSPYLREATRQDGTTMTAWLQQALELETGRPLPWRAIYDALLRVDPLTLLHGVFFSDKAFHGNPKVRRAVTPILEAQHVAPVHSGGLKRDDVRFTADKAGGSGAEEGYGFVPFSRTEWTASTITFTTLVDLHQIRGYGFSDQVTELLQLLAVWEPLAFLHGDLRLRTDCNLELAGDITVRTGPAQDAVVLPSLRDLESAIADRTSAAAGEAVTVVWAPKGGKKAA